MRKNKGQWFNLILPGLVFVAAFAAHFLWRGFFPEQDPLQSQWLSLPAESSWLRNYIETKNYWLGYSYGLSAAFASVALRSYLSSPCRESKTFAIGSVTFTGLFAAAGCFLIGCCGSPMLVVWLNLFGAAFIPFAKPFIAIVTTVSIAAAWFWMLRRKISWHGEIAFSRFPETGNDKERQ